MPAVGKRIRDIERALRRATASKDTERETALREVLQKLQEEKKTNEVKIKEKNNSQKYHMVRFVERQKVPRTTSFSLFSSYFNQTFHYHCTLHFTLPIRLIAV